MNCASILANKEMEDLEIVVNLKFRYYSYVKENNVEKSTKKTMMTNIDLLSCKLLQVSEKIKKDDE